MEKIQNISIALALVAICFSGCLGDDDTSDKNTAPEALIMMPRQADLVEAGKPFTIDGSAIIFPPTYVGGSTAPL